MKKASPHYSLEKCKALSNFITDVGVGGDAFLDVYSSVINHPDKKHLKGIKEYPEIRLAWSLIKAGYVYHYGKLFPPNQDTPYFYTLSEAINYCLQPLVEVL